MVVQFLRDIVTLFIVAENEKVFTDTLDICCWQISWQMALCNAEGMAANYMVANYEHYKHFMDHYGSIIVGQNNISAIGN